MQRLRVEAIVVPLVALCSCRDAPSGLSAGSLGDSAPASETTKAAPDEASIKALSHAFLDAYDRNDEDALTKVVAPSFTFFYEQQAHHREVLGWVHDRRAHGATPVSRTYGQEHVSIESDAVVFIGESIVHAPAEGTTPARDFDGWNTLVWVRSGAAWKLTLWEGVKGGLDADRARWDSIYSKGGAFNPAPSKFLADVVKGRKPGTALDVAMGQGRNSLYLASQGWRVTGIDISNEGLRLAREAAASRKLSIEAINADQASWDYGREKWDLVAFVYAGCDAKMVDTLRIALKRGGIVVIEAFHKDAAPAIGIGTGELATLFKDGFTIVRDETEEEESAWGLRNGIREKVVHFVAEKR